MGNTTRLSLGRPSLQKLVRGTHAFRAHYFASNRALFQQLAQGQTPHTLFISCSDSRVVPDLITSAAPGELFTVRDVGNIVPRAGRPGGVAAAVEYAVKALKVHNLIVCGHTGCGAIEAILHPEKAAELEYVSAWLAHAERIVPILDAYYPGLEGDARVVAAVEENVLVQLENLRSFDFVAEGLERGTLKMNGWVFNIGTGEVFDYDPVAEQFVRLG